MKRKVKEPEEQGCPLWMMTFGDAVSLLVTFFVMLVSFASFEESHLMDVFGAMKGGLRAIPVPDATAVGTSHSVVVPPDEAADVTVESYDELGYSREELDLETQINKIISSYTQDFYLRLVRSGLSLVIRQNEIFEPGTAELCSGKAHVWQAAADLMHAVPGEVRVEVTLWENAMVRSDHSTTPWGLGIEQSLAIRELLIRDYHADPSQISTSVRVVSDAVLDNTSNGTIEIIYVGLSHTENEHLMRRIIRGSWRKNVEGQGHGQRG